MQKHTITTYSFDELNDAAKAKARAWYREASAGDDTHSATYEDAKTVFALCGIEIDRFYYSGFWSQGDGACFEGTWRAANVEPGKAKEHAPVDAEIHRIAGEFERVALAFPHASFAVKHRGHYYHEHCTEFAVYIPDANDDQIDTPEAVRAETDLIVAAKSAMRWVYRQLEKEYEWQNADAQVDEAIRANEYPFTAEGKRSVVL